MTLNRFARRYCPYQPRAIAISIALVMSAFICRSSAGGQSAGSAVMMRSPGGTTAVTISADPFQYSVTYLGRAVVTGSPLGLTFRGEDAYGPLRIRSSAHAEENRTWTPVWGKTSQITDSYQEQRLTLEERSGQHRTLGIIVRAYDDGVAFRYQVTPRAGTDSFILEKELSGFRFNSDPVVWAGTTDSYHHSYEHEYPKNRLSQLQLGSHVILPLLAQVDAETYVAITEADLDDWAGMYLNPQGATLTTDLSPRLDGAGLVRANAPHLSPWRVLMLGTRPGSLLESNLIENLNPPSRIADTSWIKPGMMAWDHWWSGDVQMDTATNERFIAFASQMGFPYQLVDWQWYGKYNVPDADITKPAPQLNWPELLAYAKQHNVREWVWLHSGDVTRAKDLGKLDAAFATYEGWGIAGIKIDFMDRNDQEMVNWYSDVVQLAARHHLMVDYHGAFIDTGLRATWPNLLTREGVLGNEYNKFSTRVTPVHKLTLPFTRLLAGPMDYTPGGFLNRSPQEWKQTTPTQVIGSRAQELALFVVYWSPLTCVIDDPKNYEGQPGLDFLRVVPTVWDETRVLDGAVGEHIIVARRKGDRWFVGGMTADNPYTARLPLSFLGNKRYTAHLFADPTNSKASYETLDISQQSVVASDVLNLAMRPAGGVAMYLEPAY